LVRGGTPLSKRPWLPKREPDRMLGQHRYERHLFHVVVLAAMRNLVRHRDDLAARQKPLWFLLLRAPATFVAATIARF
jgi:hypothetical protein